MNRHEKRKARYVYIEPLGVHGGMGHYNDALVAQLSAHADVTVMTSSASSRLTETSSVLISRSWSKALDHHNSKFRRATWYVLGWIAALHLAGRSHSRLIVHFFHAPTLDLFFLAVARWGLGLPVIWIAHDPVPIVKRRTGLAYRLCAHTACRAVVHGSRAQADLISMGVKPDRVRVGRHGSFEPAGAIPSESAFRLLLPEGSRSLTEPIGLIIGNIKPGKGIERLLRSLAEVHPTSLSTLLIMGASQGCDAAFADTGSVSFELIRLDKRFTDEEELAAFSVASVVFATYEWGYSSGVIARAHAIGTAVILTDVGDLSFQANSHDTVIPADYSPQDLKVALDAVLSCKDKVAVASDSMNGWSTQVSAILDCDRGEPM